MFEHLNRGFGDSFLRKMQYLSSISAYSHHAILSHGKIASKPHNFSVPLQWGGNPFLTGYNYYAASCIMKRMNSGVFFHEDFNGANRFLCFCSSESLKLG